MFYGLRHVNVTQVVAEEECVCVQRHMGVIIGHMDAFCCCTLRRDVTEEIA